MVGDKRKHDVIVFKQYRFDTEYNHEDFEYMRMDTLITEMFTSSPLYVDIYGACGLSALMEAMPDGDVEELALPFQEERSPISLDDEKDVDPKNIMTVEQKITFAYEMAQALSLMHNYPGGVIVHGKEFQRMNSGHTSFLQSLLNLNLPLYWYDYLQTTFILASLCGHLIRSMLKCRTSIERKSCCGTRKIWNIVAI